MLFESRVVVGGGGTSSESSDGADGTRGVNLVCRSEFEVLEVLPRRGVVGSGGIFVGEIDGGGILCGGSGAGGMRGENLVRRNGFEVLEVLTGRGVIGGVRTSNTSNSLRHTRFSPRVSPAVQHSFPIATLTRSPTAINYYSTSQ